MKAHRRHARAGSKDSLSIKKDDFAAVIDRELFARW